MVEESSVWPSQVEEVETDVVDANVRGNMYEVDVQWATQPGSMMGIKIQQQQRANEFLGRRCS
jgi:hypothetical protein